MVQRILSFRSIVAAPIALCVVSSMVPNAAFADDAAANLVGAANRAYGALEYDACIEAADGSLKTPGTRSERIDAHRLLGLCRAALGDTDGARDAFAKMLGLDPRAELPPGLSPRFTSAFLEARGFWVGKNPLGFRIENDEKRGKTRVLTITVDDEIGLVREVVWRGADGAAGDPVIAAARMEIEVPATVADELVALDDGGGTVAVLAIRTTIAPPDELPSTTTAVEDESEGSLIGSPFLWVGVGSVAAVVVVGTAVAVGVGVLFYEPRTVNLRSQVDFAE